ncbi:MAG: helix-turn-helix transcriptional regulator [Oscillospiraceae bacterium]|nr:helix-turn-helix transcriptional regulator [Oscillospiraceae bacterium]
MNLKEIGSRIKAERKSQNLSQEKLAEIINVSPHYIYEIERGLKAMSLETLINLSTALNISTDYVLFGDKQNSSPSLAELLNALDDPRRQKAENAFKALLPYIK